MNKLIWYLRGFVRVRITGAGLERFLNLLADCSIPFWDLEWKNHVIIEISLFPRDLEMLQRTAERELCEVSSAEKLGIKRQLKALTFRPLFFAAMVLSIVLIVWLQRHLLFYEVVGNETIPSEEILRTLDEIDVGFGVYGADLKPRTIKDNILNKMPQLQWLTITQNGCMAQVVVRERKEAPDLTDRKGFANIVASHAGLITKQAVYEGQALKKSGDFVTQGEMLVSGVVDLERIFSVVYAQAEIFARTWRNKSVTTPEKCLNKTYSSDEYLCIWLEIGKRRIKICGNSGISHTACDKIVSKRYLTLPGDYTLPVAILVERFIPYTTSETEVDQVEAQWMLQTYIVESINSEMCAGEILSERSSLVCENGRYQLNAHYECHEMIAKTVEGIWKKEDLENG